jgi:hypothetical protein
MIGLGGKEEQMIFAGQALLSVAVVTLSSPSHPVKKRTVCNKILHRYG